MSDSLIRPVVQIHIDTVYCWRTTTWGTATVHAIGDDAAARAVVRLLDGGQVAACDAGAVLRDQTGCFAVILETAGYIAAFVDRCRSYQVFYVEGPDGGAVSNSARHLRAARGLVRTDDTGAARIYHGRLRHWP